jgi:trk system potassium uptake protein TrkH
MEDSIVCREKTVSEKNVNIKPTQTIVIGFAVIILIGSILLSLSVASRNGESVGFINALFTAMGITPGLGNIGKATLIITMFIGRVGVLTMALALLSKSQDKYISYRYREEKVMVG